LDPQTTESILSLLEDVKNRLGLTVVLITHEMNVITRICDRVAVMEAGRIVEMGSVIEVFARPQHPASKSFAEVIHQRSRFLETEYRPKGLLLRLGFIGQSVGDPLVSSLVRNFSLEPNILQAHVDRIKDTAYGSLLLDLSGNPEDIEAGLDFLRSLDITLEVLS
jgi:D-methionine transport system ATP-binding protein